MRSFLLAALGCLVVANVDAQYSGSANLAPNTENIYTIKQQFLYNVLHNPNDKEGEDDNELARFNRWFHDVEVRTYPSGNLPRPDVILTAMMEAQKTQHAAHKGTSGAPVWTPIGPNKVPVGWDGIGRINCIVIDPVDTNKIFVGAACGGVFISHDHGATWASNSDQFPSLSVADIVVNPRHTDTIYAATGDGYGYETGSYNIFWGGLYSAGVVMSTDGGNTWNTTGLSFLQTNKDIIQKLLIHPANPNILLAASRSGLWRSTDAGATWNNMDAGHIYSIAFKPGNGDTVYAINGVDLRVSYNAGLSWYTINAGVNPGTDRCSIAVTPASPNSVYLLDASNQLRWSHNRGYTFYTTNPPDTAHFYGYYDRVLAVSPADSNYILAFGMYMGLSTDGGIHWDKLNQYFGVHVDNHAVAINPQRPTTIYCGNDGGISQTIDAGIHWKNLGDGLMISQIYRMGQSQQDPNILILGLQDNGSLVFDGTTWTHVTGGDGEACAIHPWNDLLQISSSQNGAFNMSFDQGLHFTGLDITTQPGAWTSPVAFDPNNQNNIYFGYKDIYATHDQATTFVPITHGSPFAYGATMLAVAPSNSNVIYGGDLGKLIRSSDGGASWYNASGGIPTAFVGITDIAIDPKDAMHIIATTSGYVAGDKVYASTNGGASWTNISADLPNIPADCIAFDTTTPGALFVGTDMGVYYTDSSQTGWTLYNTGLPNVIVNDLEVNYSNYKIRAATYGRGVWECAIKKAKPNAVKQVSILTGNVSIFPNPSNDNWKLKFGAKPANFTVRVSDATGKVLATYHNKDVIDASKLATGVYSIEVTAGSEHCTLKAIRG